MINGQPDMAGIQNPEEPSVLRTVLLSFIFALLISAAAVSAVFAASFEKLSGTVELRRTGQDFFVQAAVGQTVRPGDVLRTGMDGKAVVRLDDGSTFSFAEDSEFELGRELAGEEKGVIGKLVQGAARIILSKRPGSFVATPTSVIGIRGTDITLAHTGEVGFYFLDEGSVGIEVEGRYIPLDTGQMTASYTQRRPLPPFPFGRSSGLSEARDRLAAMTSVEVPASLKNRAQLNEILARWVINYAHYLADAGRPEDAATALLIAEELTGRQAVKGEILLQIGGLYFYHLNDVEGALRSYRRIIREYHHTPHYENALYGAIRCFLLLDQRAKAREYALRYMQVFPEGRHVEGVEALVH